MARIDDLREKHGNNPMLQYILRRQEERGNVDRRQLLEQKAANNPKLAYLLQRLDSRSQPKPPTQTPTQ